jgi:hypothetical protein
MRQIRVRRKAIAKSDKDRIKYKPTEIITKEKVQPNNEVINEKVDSNNDVKYFVPILKANKEKMTLTGVVLQPEIVDAQGDIISAEVIEKAAHNFLAGYNVVSKLGLQHKIFEPQFELYESYILPIETTIGNTLIKSGSWIIVIHILSNKIWKDVKKGKFTGFSIGGVAKVKKMVKA